MIDFVKVEKTVRVLKNQVKANQLDQATFEEKLLALVDIADDGYYWMFGHKTEQWYRHNGHTWVPDSPGEMLVTPSSPSNDHHSGSDDPSLDWSAIEVGWFALAVTLIAVLFFVVYASAA